MLRRHARPEAPIAVQRSGRPGRSAQEFEVAVSERLIELVLAKRGVVARARLHQRQAPRTCQLLWDLLPIERESIHAIFSGCELYVVWPWEGEPPPRENFTVCTDAGDLFFYYAPWYHADARPGGEIAIYYDRDAIPTGGDGLMAGCLFATIVENGTAFAAACDAMSYQGAESLLIRRAAEAP